MPTPPLSESNLRAENEVFFGLEVDGCLTGPAPLADYLLPEKRSGYTPVGTFA